MAEHKRAEEKLQKSEEQYRTMLELAGVGASQVDPFTGRFLYVNPNMSEITGYSEEELLSMRFLEVTHPGDREEDSERLQRMVRGEATERAYEKRYVRKDGRVVWVQVNATLNRDEAGRPVRMIAVIQDITEHKRVKEALRKSEELHRFAVEAGRIGTWDLDLQTEECLVSPKMAELMGFSPDQTTVPGAQWRESVVSDDRALMTSALAATIESDAPFDLEFRIALKDGTERWLYSRGGVSRDASGKALRVHGASIDVTERKRAEEKSRASKERLRRATEIETVGVIFFKTDGSITDANDAFLHMSGYSREDLVEGLVRWDEMTPPEWMPHSLKAIEEFESTGRTIPYEKEYVRKDGSRWWALFAATRLDEKEGVEFIIDITQSKQAEETLRKSSRRVENILESITEEFFAVDREWRFTYINERSFHRIRREKGEELTREELLGKNVWELYPELVGTVFYHKYHEALREQKTVHFEADSPLSDTWYEVHVYPSEEGLAVYYHDISERKRAQKEIETRTHQQAVVAELGLWALANKNLPSLMDDAVALVARTLDVEYCKIMELLPSGEELLLRTGVGWKEGLVGRATEGTDFGSQAGYTLRSGGPVITEDLHTEKRFRCPPLLREHGAVSGMTVVIQGREQPFGVLGAHTKSRRTFSEDDVNFLQAVANLLAMRIEREEADKKLQEVREGERSRMARDLHDEALRDLSDALAEAQHIQSISKDPKPARRLGHLVAALKRVGQQLRGAIYDLRLGREQDRPFAELLESLVELHRTMAPECDIRLNLQDGVLFGPLGETGGELLRIVGEALTNARRHSGAWNVWVAVGTSEGKLWAEISDDGQGVDLVQEEPSAAGGMGIRGMRERAHALGGDLKIESEPGKGTKVRFDMALKKDREEPEEEIRVLLVEDHASFREALASVLEREPDFEVVGQVSTLAEARKMVEDGPAKADVAIIDLALPDGYGGNLIKELREANSETQALVLSASLDRAEIGQAIESGAAGVLHKSALLDEVAEAVRRLRAGETLLPLEEVVELLRFAAFRREQEYEAHQVIALLTPREKEVLQALAEGLDSQEIAERLQISVRTERNHMASIFNKLRVHSRLQALVFALRHGVIDLR